MTEEEKKAKLKSLIEEYEVCYKESKYEGNVEEYKNLKETHKLLKDILNLISKLQADIEIKDKVIDYAIEEIHSIVNLGEFIDRNIDKLDTKEEIKQYILEKVEEEKC